MELWLDAPGNEFGLEAEPSYEPTDAKAVSFTLEDMRLEVLNDNAASVAAVPGVATHPSNHPNLPRIRFLPDGTISQSSPQAVRVTGRDGISIWLTQSTNQLSYELRTSNN